MNICYEYKPNTQCVWLILNDNQKQIIYVGGEFFFGGAWIYSYEIF